MAEVYGIYRCLTCACEARAGTSKRPEVRTDEQLHQDGWRVLASVQAGAHTDRWFQCIYVCPTCPMPTQAAIDAAIEQYQQERTQRWKGAERARIRRESPEPRATDA